MIETLATHSSREEYRAVLDATPISTAHRWDLAARRQKFAQQWPDLGKWMLAPMPTRVGRLKGETRRTLTDPISYEARDYLYYLALTGRLRLDYEWLFAISVIWPGATASRLGIDLGVAAMTDRGMALGYSDVTISMAARWLLPRLAMHAGIKHARDIRPDHLDEIQSAVDRFGDREDLELFHAPRPQFLKSASRTWSGYIWRARMILYHDGKLAHPPRKSYPTRPEPTGGPPAMQAVVERWLEVSASQFRPGTVYIRKIALRLFLQHIRKSHPAVTTFREITRSHVEDYLAALAKRRLSNGAPMALRTRRNRVMGLVRFFRDVVELEWEDGPERILIDARDAPRCNEHVPRYIPEPELDVVMAAVSRITCRFRRVALLLARWSGARRNEIARLSLDCLDMYPDGKTPRLRIPAGKIYRERIIPVHPEAAESLRELISFRSQETDRPLLDEFTGEMVRYVFSMKGRRLSTIYLFTRPLQLVCDEAGLVDDKGIGIINAHRFRHTLGTQLANSGATIQTIMKVLGHQSPEMAMVYAHISDTEVLRDYQAVLAPGAVLAGPGAERVRTRGLSTQAVDWLKTNFFKTELELGHCLRLPEEGPCQCDLYLSCACFVTTPAYAGRLRGRRETELLLAEDARERGWSREVERHCTIADRISGLLAQIQQQTGIQNGAEDSAVSG